MGATASISPTAELIVSGRIVTTDLQVSGTGSTRIVTTDLRVSGTEGTTIGGGNTAQRSVYPLLGTIRYNSQTGYMEAYTVAGWGSIATPPLISTISPTAFGGNIGEEFTINGSFFDVNTTVVFKGADSTEYASATVTFVSAVQLKVTNATTLPVANEPYKVVVTNGAGLSVTSIQAIDAGSLPTFTTSSGQIAASGWGTAINTSITATDPDTSIASYSIVAGSLPSGATLNATTGAITGTTTGSGTVTHTFTVQATDTGGNTNTRQFSIAMSLITPNTTLTQITNHATMKDVAYLTIPGGPRTLLNFVSTYGSATSTNDGSASWNSGKLVTSFDYRQNNSYFLTSSMKLYSGDGSVDTSDWVLFNFGQAPPVSADWSPAVTSAGHAFFGGELATQSGATNGGTASTGYIWGWTTTTNSWVLLWRDVLGTLGAGTYPHLNVNWYQSGGTVTSGNGKYTNYDTLSITHIGFSVS